MVGNLSQIASHEKKYELYLSIMYVGNKVKICIIAQF